MSDLIANSLPSRDNLNSDSNLLSNHQRPLTHTSFPPFYNSSRSCHTNPPKTGEPSFLSLPNPKQFLSPIASHLFLIPDSTKRKALEQACSPELKSLIAQIDALRLKALGNSSLNSRDTDGLSFLDRCYSIVCLPRKKEIQDQNISGSEILKQALLPVIAPTAITQGDRETCASAAIHIIQCLNSTKQNNYLGNYLKIVDDITSNRAGFRTSEQRHMTIPSSAIARDNSRRSDVERFLQAAFTEYVAGSNSTHLDHQHKQDRNDSVPNGLDTSQIRTLMSVLTSAPYERRGVNSLGKTTQETLTNLNLLLSQHGPILAAAHYPRSVINVDLTTNNSRRELDYRNTIFHSVVILKIENDKVLIINPSAHGPFLNYKTGFEEWPIEAFHKQFKLLLTPVEQHTR